MRNFKTVSSFLFVFVAIGLIFAPVVLGQSAEKKMERVKTLPNRNALPFFSGKTDEQKAEILSKMSGPAMLSLAKIHGITTICGKSIEENFPGNKTVPNRMNFADNPVAADPALRENHPSIAVKPNNGNIIVAACSNYPVNGYTEIGTYTSLDKGMTWSGPHYLPKRYTTDRVYGAVVRFAPNSSYVYACYVSTRYDSSNMDVMVTRSTNNGMTWSTPKVAIPGGDWTGDGYVDLLDLPRIDVHPFPDSAAANPMVYVTCTQFGSDGYNYIVFARSKDSASTFPISNVWRFYWSDGRVLQGSRPIGGRGGDVVLAFYSASDDGWGPGVGGGGYFDIDVVKMANYGTTFVSWVRAVYRQYYELPYYLGPLNGSNIPYYHRWWFGMCPSIAMTPSGVLYIAFAADPVSGQSQSSREDGDIYLIKSPRPYTEWGYVSPYLGYFYGFGSDAGDGYPTIGVKKTTNGAIVALAWEFHGNSPFDNELYDIMTIYNGGTGWRGYFQLTDVSSVSKYNSVIHDSLDCGVSANVNDRVINIIWTDRSDVLSTTDPDDDVYTDILELIY